MKKVLQLVALTALFAAVSITSGCTRINPGHVGIVVNNAGSNKGVENYTPTTGWVFYMPGKTAIYEYPTFVQTAIWSANPNEGHKNDESITFTTKDDMVVSADISLSYHLISDKVPSFYTQFRSDDLDTFTHGFLRNVARDKFNEVGGNYTVEQIMGDNGPFLKLVRDNLQAEVGKYGVSIDQFGFVGAPRPPQNVIAAINSKVEAQQNAMKVQNEVAMSQAEAQKRVALAEGEAKANQALASSISPQLLEWRKLEIQQEAIRRWNGTVPQVSSNGSGLLFELPSNK